MFQVQRNTVPLEGKETHQLLALAVTVEDIDPGAVLGLVGLQQVQPLQLPGGMVERAALFLHLQPHPLQVAAVLALLKLTATTALTQPLILWVVMVAGAVVLDQLPLVQVAMAAIPVAVAVAAVQVTVWTPVLAATAVMATSVS